MENTSKKIISLVNETIKDLSKGITADKLEKMFRYITILKCVAELRSIGDKEKVKEILEYFKDDTEFEILRRISTEDHDYDMNNY